MSTMISEPSSPAPVIKLAALHQHWDAIDEKSAREGAAMRRLVELRPNPSMAGKKWSLVFSRDDEKAEAIQHVLRGSEVDFDVDEFPRMASDQAA